MVMPPKVEGRTTCAAWKGFRSRSRYHKARKWEENLEAVVSGGLGSGPEGYNEATSSIIQFHVRVGRD